MMLLVTSFILFVVWRGFCFVFYCLVRGVGFKLFRLVG